MVPRLALIALSLVTIELRRAFRARLWHRMGRPAWALPHEYESCED